MSAWIRIGCFITGWNRHILKSCSEASYKHLKKYTSALLILIILWAFTGYCFAERYVHAPWWGCMASSFLFIVVIVQIERQIILTVGTTKWIALFRVFIAIIMSIIGSSIIDQIIFANDIDKKMVQIVDQQVKEQLPMRLSIIDAKLSDLRIEIDSLEKANSELNKELVRNPTIITVTTSVTNRKFQQPDGNIITIPEVTSNKIPVENPITGQIKTNNDNLEQFRKQQEEYTKRRMEAEEKLREELASKTGFLEELNAVLKIMDERNEALIFYLIIFSFLISLELFVVASKIGDTKCDYDLVVKHQLDTRKKSLEKINTK